MKQENNSQPTGLEIAVVGMAGRFPAARNIHEYWENLKNGVESVSFYTEEELKKYRVPVYMLENPGYVASNGGLLRDIEYFDAAFFGYTPREAEIMDPQLRIFLECAWEALEDSGYYPDNYEGQIGLYAGASDNLHWAASTRLSQAGQTVDSFTLSHLTNRDFVTTHVSYKLNLTGPSVAIQTACSTSLVAIDHACRALLTGICDMALAGGVSLYPFERQGYIYQEGLIRSPDGHCRVFDENARGIADGEGVGVIVLKRLEDALGEGDHIEAVVKGFAVNNDGIRKPGFTAPSIDGQLEVINAAMQMAEVEPESITYIETHGTGTPLGDPIELEGLKLAFNTAKTGFCGIGSVKSNIGHLDAAAGAASFIKTVLVLKLRLIPPTLNFQSPNPKIDFINSPFYVNSVLTKWENKKYPLRAGISAFGIGGTNAHVILEQAPEIGKSSTGRVSREYQLVTISAKTASALEKRTLDLGAHIKNLHGADLADIAYTLQMGRKPFNYRRVFLAQNRDEALEALLCSNSQRVSTFHVQEEKPPVVFIFLGHETQWKKMVTQLYKKEPLFRKEMDNCLTVYESLTGVDLKGILNTDKDESRTIRDADGIEHSHPVIFIYEYVLARVLMNLGIEPQAMMGCYLGEYVAACLAGIFSFENALELVILRSKPVSQLSLTDQALYTIPLDMQENFLEEFENKIARFPSGKHLIPYISGVTGEWSGVEDATDPVYWLKQLTTPVSYAQGLKELIKSRNTIVVEIGSPVTRLSSSIEGREKIQNLVRLSAADLDHRSLLMGIGQLWLYGKNIDWNVFYPGETGQRISLPTYPFEGKRFRIDKELPQLPSVLSYEEDTGLIKRENMADWFYTLQWERSAPDACQSLEALNQSPLLVFVNQTRLVCLLVEQLRHQGIKVITAAEGQGFKEINKGEFIINPRHPDDYRELFNCLLQRQLFPGRIVHAWGFTGESRQEDDSNFFNRAQDLGFYSLLYLAKTLGKLNLGTEIQIDVVTDHLYDVTGEEVLIPEKATVLGPAKVIPQEYPFIICRSIDIMVSGKGSNREKKLLDLLLDEMAAKPVQPEVAIRGNYRWIPTYQPYPLAKAPGDMPKLKKKGVYLVTGGVGNIGLILAAYLAETVNARLVLTGRSPLPPRDEWEQWLIDHPGEDPVSRKLERIRAIEKHGGEVMTIQADVSNPDEMQQVIREAEERFGPINGVIHAAGRTTGKAISCSIEEVGTKECEQQFAPKIHGLLVLAKLLENKKIDFCIITSSLSPILGGLGFAAYSAVNFFSDLFVRKYNQENKIKWTGINWEGWESEEQKKQIPAFGAIEDELAMTPGEIVEAFKRIQYQSKIDQIIISSGNLQARIDKWVKLKTLRENADSSTRENRVSSPGISRPNLSSQYIAPRGRTEKIIAAVWERLFGYENLGIRDDFFELGGDSLKAITLLSRIQKEINITLSISDFFENPTIERISKCLSSQETRRHPGVVPVETREYYPLSSSQRGFYFGQQLEVKGFTFNMAEMYMMESRLDKTRLEEIFKILINRHESLRTSFPSIDGKPVQRIQDEKDLDFSLEYSSAGDEEFKEIGRRFLKDFNLEKAPLLRAKLVDMGQKRSALMVDMHHIITDGVSHEILIAEFLHLYYGEELPGIKCQYKDFSQWQNKRFETGELKEQEEYWFDRFKSKPLALNIPTDYPGPVKPGTQTSFVDFALETEETRKVKAMAIKAEVTIFILIMAVYNVFLSKLSGKEDIVVITISAGRNHADLNHIIGAFVNTLLLRNFPVSTRSFNEFLKEVKDSTLRAFENQDYRFENLAEKIGIVGRDRNNTFFEVGFTMQNFEDNSKRLEVARGLEITQASLLHSEREFPFVINLEGTEDQDRVFFRLYYHPTLFEKETVLKYCDFFKKIILCVAENPGMKLRDIMIVSSAEREIIDAEIMKTNENIIADFNL